MKGRHYLRRPPAVTAAEARRLVVEEDALIVDVRRTPEWRRQHIPGSVHLPLEHLTERCFDLPDDRLIVTFCTGGLRSAGAANQLVELGFDALNLSRGLIGWRSIGGPLVGLPDEPSA